MDYDFRLREIVYAHIHIFNRLYNHHERYNINIEKSLHVPVQKAYDYINLPDAELAGTCSDTNLTVFYA